ncbi:hypothetical protein FDA94_29265 [Herbidospora galbida]|uniref:Uncharacterized protein n=1 Tax=Herbidospora galbida TaxID=2575442 RepID=A0A4U3MAU0_9ACTN|nr:hypothetical protein [Herbidospora galbida]TKK84706.1 hypothetical protein FDA94_29265 [Herbidospora galbida]
MQDNITTPGSLIGHRKNGDPIYLIGGGSSDDAPQWTDSSSTTPPAAPPANGPFYTAEDLEKARREEKDKLYNRMNQLATKVNSQDEILKTWQAEREAAAQAEEEARKAAEEQVNQQRREEMSAKELLEETTRQWQARLDAIEAERAQERAARENERLLEAKEREFLELQNFTRQRVTEESENILPELLDLITGNTRDEIEASIVAMKARSAKILDQVSAASAELGAMSRGASLTGYGATGPLEQQSGTKTYTADEIRSMPMNEYAANRHRLHGASASGNGYGMFG